MGDPYSLITKKNKSKNIISKFLLEREVNKLFRTHNIELIIQIGSMIVDESFHKYYQEKLVELANPKFVYLYAKYVKNANIEILENAILNYNDLEFICLFLREIKNCTESKFQKKIIDLIINDNLIGESFNYQIETIEDLIILTKNINIMYEYLLKFKTKNISKFQKAIINNGTSEDIISFSNYMHGLDINSLENELIEKKDYRTIYKLAVYNKSANIEKIQNAILESKNAKYIYRFSLQVENCNISLLEKAIIDTNNLEYMNKFIQNIKKCDKEKMLDAIIKSNNILSDKIEILIDIALQVENINFDKIEQFIINSNLAKYVYLFALQVEKSNKQLLEKKIIELNNVKYLCNYALHVRDADINKIEYQVRNNKQISDFKIIIEFYEIMLERKLISIDNYEEAIINYGHAKYMYELLKKHYNEINLEKIEKAIINTKDGEYIYKFAKFKNKDILKEENALVELKDYTYLVFFYNLENANKERIENIILNSQIARCIYYYAIKATDVNIEKIEEAIINTKDEEYINKIRLLKEYINEESNKKNEKTKIMQKKLK